MAKMHQEGRTASHRIACNLLRNNTGWEARGTANLLRNMDHNFESMLKADDVDGLHDRELDQIEKARKEVRNAAKRLEVIDKRCSR